MDIIDRKIKKSLKYAKKNFIFEKINKYPVLQILTRNYLNFTILWATNQPKHLKVDLDMVTNVPLMKLANFTKRSGLLKPIANGSCMIRGLPLGLNLFKYLLPFHKTVRLPAAV